MCRSIERHLAGDWGDVDEHARKANDRALTKGTRLLSFYHAANGTKFWLLTEAHRGVTTTMLPEDC